MKKTSWTLIVLVLVVLTSVGIAYGQGFELFAPLITQPRTFSRTMEKHFEPPASPLDRWLQPIPDPEPIDFSGLLMARAEKAAADAQAAAMAEAAADTTVEKPAPSVRAPESAAKETPKSTQPDNPPENEKPPVTKPPEETKPPAEEPPAAEEPPPAPSPLKPPAGTAPTANEKRVFDLVNHARAAEGLKPLTLSIDLLWLARLRSEDLVAHGGTLTHNTPTYGNTGQMLLNAGISYRGCGENLAKTFSAERAVERWLASEAGHRENMLSTNFTHTGVGIARLDSTYIIISQVFINQK